MFTHETYRVPIIYLCRKYWSGLEKGRKGDQKGADTGHFAVYEAMFCMVTEDQLIVDTIRE